MGLGSTFIYIYNLYIYIIIYIYIIYIGGSFKQSCSSKYWETQLHHQGSQAPSHQFWVVHHLHQVPLLPFAPEHHGGFALIYSSNMNKVKRNKMVLAPSLNVFRDVAPIPKTMSQGASWCQYTSLPPSKDSLRHTNFSWYKSNWNKKTGSR